jgi:hypothetical protein
MQAAELEKGKERVFETIEYKKRERAAQNDARTLEWIHQNRLESIKYFDTKLIPEIIEKCKAAIFELADWEPNGCFQVKGYSIKFDITIQRDYFKIFDRARLQIKTVVKYIDKEFHQKISEDASLDANGNNINAFKIKIKKPSKMDLEDYYQNQWLTYTYCLLLKIRISI